MITGCRTEKDREGRRVVMGRLYINSGVVGVRKRCQLGEDLCEEGQIDSTILKQE